MRTADRSVRSEQYAQLAEAIAETADPIVAYKTARYLRTAAPTSAALEQARCDIADTPVAQGLLADLAMSDPDDRDGLSTISMTLRYLAEIDYPPGDSQLVPYRDVVYQ